MEIYKLHRAFIGDEEILYRRTPYKPRLPTLLMLTGWPVASVSLVPLMSLLKDTCNCVALDLPGFGMARLKQHNKFCGFDFYSAIIYKFQMEVLQEEVVNLFGYSMGGVHFLYYSFKYPEMVSKLVLFGPPYYGINEILKNKIKDTRIYEVLDYLKDKPRLINILNKDFVSLAVCQLIYSKIYRHKCRQFVDDNQGLMNTLFYESSRLDFKAALDVAHDLEDRDFIAAASEVKTPTLVIAAEYDETVSLYRSRKLAEDLMINANFCLLKNLDHSAVLTDYQKVAAPIIKFLSLS